MGKKPNRIFEQCRVGMRCAVDFFARHGMSGKKAGLAGAAEERTRLLFDDDFTLPTSVTS